MTDILMRPVVWLQVAVLRSGEQRRQRAWLEQAIETVARDGLELVRRPGYPLDRAGVFVSEDILSHDHPFGERHVHAQWSTT
jgi:hypothetical protein